METRFFGFLQVYRQWGFVYSKHTNVENKVNRSITFNDRCFFTLLTYKDDYVKSGTLTILTGKDLIDSFTYWDSTPTEDVNNVYCFSIGK